MQTERIRVLIWGKTYPELSSKHVETVCTAGVREDGTPIRLYPVPLRYLSGDQQYSLYDWVDVTVAKSTSDPRPESYKLAAEEIAIAGHIDTKDNWRQRREAVFQLPDWQFGSVDALKAAQSERNISFGIVSPGEILDVRVEKKGPQAAAEFAAKMAEIQAQRDLFRTEYKALDFLPSDVILSWRCTDDCACRSGTPHSMKVLDWGLLELGRRDGWDKAAAQLRAITSKDHDFKLFMGNFRLRWTTFGIVGLWYPKKAKQLSFL